MATDAANSTPPPPVVNPREASQRPAARHADGGNGVGYDALVERHLRRTQNQVKLVDLCTALMLLVAGVVGYLLSVAVVDHWVYGLGFGGRLLALGVLLAGSGWYVVTAVVPLLIHRINPLYAARSIEQGTPTLKNSLINFLMFRANQATVHRVVYQAMEQKAATDLASVPVDTAVDRSRMIQAGYVLVAVLVCGGAYTILSPKDPFQTLARVAAPWQAIARPSRVTIEEVQPGTVEVIQGQFVEVAARVRGVRAEKDTVTLVYSTHDGQTVARSVAMQLDENGVAYHGQLPAESAGLQQDLEYRVESGDAVSESFTVTLSPAPVILVESIEYEFPPYTKRTLEKVRREGNIRALEGTRVTIFANANKPIRAATITFNPFQPSGGARPPVKQAMEVEGTTAQHTFTLALMGDRRTPAHEAYHLSFVTTEGVASQQPILHQIDVVPDLAPDVAILDPTQNRIKVPVSGRRAIEIRAADPDFGLSRLKLRAVSGGTDVLDKVLFEDPSGRRGQVIQAFEFVPSSLGLAANDNVTYWAVADDNRGPSAGDRRDGNQWSPNSARTRDYYIEIVPDPPQPASGTGQTASDEQPPSAADASKANGDKSPEDKPAEDKAGDDPRSPEDPAADSSATPDEAEKQPQDAEETKSDDGGGGESESQASSPDAESQQGKGGAGAPQEGQTEPGNAATSDGSGGNTPQAGGKPEGASSGEGGNPPPEQLHDGEVFEQVLRKIQEEQAAGKGRPDPNNPNTGQQGDDPPPRDGSDQQEGTPSEKPSGSANDQSKPRGDATGSSEGSDTQSQPFNADGQTPRKPNPANQEAPGDEAQPGDGAQQPDQKRGAGDQKDGNPGEGGDTNPTSGEQQGKQKPDVPGERDQRPKEPGSGDNGESGAGQNSQDTEGTGSVEASQDQTVNNRDKPKSSNPENTTPQEKSDPGATNSKKQSDSEGGESGDQSGGGKKGPGQGANQAGNDSAGQNNAADDGAGAASEAGDGETSDNAGNKQEAAGKTGSSGNQKGDGSSSRKDPNGKQPNNDGTGSSPEAAPSQENRQPRDSASGGGGDQPGKSDLPTGGGVPSDVRHNSGLDPNLEVAEGDAAKLEYSRKTTDMVIDYLKDMESRPDPELLRDLGWTPDELKQFVDRWQRLKRGAADERGSRELDESLRSLGLRAPGSKSRQRNVRSDDQRGLSESGEVSQPPATYRDQFDAFRKNAARARDR